MLSIYGKHGRVTFTSDYLQRIVADAASIYLFLALLQLTSLKPHICAMLPIALSELILLLQALHKYQPSFARVSQPLMNRLMGFTLSSQEYSSYERSSDTLKWSLITTKTAIFCMYSELFQAVVLTVELLFPSRSFIQLYLWTQFLRMRVMMDTSGQFRTIFAKLDVYISALLSHG